MCRAKQGFERRVGGGRVRRIRFVWLETHLALASSGVVRFPVGEQQTQERVRGDTRQSFNGAFTLLLLPSNGIGNLLGPSNRRRRRPSFYRALLTAGHAAKPAVESSL